MINRFDTASSVIARYNLSEMSTKEAVELIPKDEGQLCVRLYRRTDGRVLTSDCQGGVRWRIWTWLRKKNAWGAAIFAMFFLPACAQRTMGLVYDDNRAISLQTPPTVQSEGKTPIRIEQDQGEPSIVSERPSSKMEAFP